MTLPGCPSWPRKYANFYRQEGCWRGETFGGMLRQRADTLGGRTAVISVDRQISYKELDDNVDRLATGLQRLGIRQGDRVVVQLPNIIEFFDVIFALFRLGALPVFALPLHRRSEISHFCETTEAVAYIIPAYYAEFDYRTLAREVNKNVSKPPRIIVAGEAEEFISLAGLYIEGGYRQPEIDAGDVAFLQLSGGSTGLSKLIPRTHDEYIYSLRASNEICRMDKDSVYLAALPVAHNFPLSSPGVLGTLYAGGTIVLALSPSPEENFPLIEKYGVTITALVPPLALIWLEAVPFCRYDLSSLAVLQVGGAKFSEQVARRVMPAFGCKLQQVFGMAEGLVNYTRLDDDEETIVSTQGLPMSQYDEIRIVDEDDAVVEQGAVGELLTRGPYTIPGYYKAQEYNAKAFTPDGFYRTGDLVRINEAGYIVVEGRAKDQINRGGEKIGAEEVEGHLLGHEAVLDAAIVAMPDEYLGERSCAFVILRDQGVTAGQLKQFLKECGIALYKIPDRIEFVSSFPYTPLGKVSKKQLRQMIADRLAGSR